MALNCKYCVTPTLRFPLEKKRYFRAGAALAPLARLPFRGNAELKIVVA